MQTMVYWMAVSAALVSTAQSEDFRNLQVKSVFSREFPQVLDFRGEYGHSQWGYQDYSDDLRLMDASLKKLVPEELDHIRPELVQWANRYAREHPETLMLLHLNGEARQAHDHPEVQKRYFPGHWVYQPGQCSPRMPMRRRSCSMSAMRRSSRSRPIAIMRQESGTPGCAPRTNGSGGQPLVVRFGIRLRPRCRHPMQYDHGVEGAIWLRNG